MFFIGKTDAWDENKRLLKLGKVRVKFTPALATTNGFRQELKLRDGVIEISNRQTRISVWVDANHPVIQVDAKSADRPAPGSPRLVRGLAQGKAVARQCRERRRQRILLPPATPRSPAFSYPDTILPRHRRNRSAGITATWNRRGCRA